MKNFEEKTIKTNKIYDGKIISVQVDDVRLPDGNQAKRELVKHPGAVAIIAQREDGKILFVKQYRKALDKTILEIPAGRLEKGEKPEETGLRELEEETGYTTDRLSFVTSFYTSPGFADEIIYLYQTDSLQKLSQAVAGDEDEFIELKALTLEEALQYVKEQKFMTQKQTMPYYTYKLYKRRGSNRC